MNIMRQLELEHMKSSLPDFGIGDSVDVHYLIREGDKERVQLFSGTVIAFHGSGISRTVKVTAAAVTQGSLSVSISATNEVVQPEAGLFGGAGEAVEVQNADIEVVEEANPMFLSHPGVDLRDIVEAGNEVGASPSSLIAILEALKSSGSLRAELLVI